MNTTFIKKITKQKLAWSISSKLSYIVSGISIFILFINVVSTPYSLFTPYGLLVLGFFCHYKSKKCQSITEAYPAIHKVRLDPNHIARRLARKDSILRLKLYRNISMTLTATGIIAFLELLRLLDKLHRQDMIGISDSIGVIIISILFLMSGTLWYDSIKKNHQQE